MELISVIVPIYKAEKYLDRCVRSIIQQTYQKIEILLIDDGSPDQCPVICDRWAAADPRVKVIHQNNSGVSVARNTGLANARGKYIMMVDSDDYLYSGIIESMYRALHEQDADLVICEHEKGRAETFEFTYQETIPFEIIDAETALSRIYINSEKALQYVAPWAKLYKKELFEGIQYPKGKIFEDIYVTHQLLYRCNKIVVIPQKMIYYFQHPDSIMNREFHVGKLDYLEALKNRIDFYKEHKLKELSEIAYDEYMHALIWEYSRARDVLTNKDVMQDIVARYRTAYKKGYSSRRYSEESARFLRVFNLNPEFIILYWKITAKFKARFHKQELS